MNFVGHIYLSGSNEKIAIGNFIGDYVKGRGYEKFPPEIQKGILIHRDIDATMDLHPAFLATRNLLKETYGRYAGVVTDIAFDYILTKYWSEWHTVPLKKFTRKFYGILLRSYRLLPSEVKQFLPFMIRSNRLYSYSKPEGIARALEIMATYTSLPEKSREAIAVITANEEEIAANFNLLMCDMLVYLNDKYGLTPSEKGMAQIARYRQPAG